MLKYHLDGLARIDANLNIFSARALEQIRAQLFSRKYPAFKGRRFVPVKNDIDLGAQSYTYQTIDEAGEALPVSPKGDDAPEVELKGLAEDNHKMRGIELAYSWTLDELRAAQYAGRGAFSAGVDMLQRKAGAARRGIERFIDKNMLIGGTILGATHQGLFTLSGGQAPTTYTVQNTTWEDETPDEIAQDLAGIVTQIVTDTLETEMPNAMILPVSSNRLICDRRMGDGSNVTIKAYFLGAQATEGGISQIDTSLYLEAFNASTKVGVSGRAVKRMVAYVRDNEHVEALVNEFEQLPPEFRATKTTTVCRARVGGVASYFPKAVAYGDNI